MRDKLCVEAKRSVISRERRVIDHAPLTLHT
jgi:hypothetical protein